MKGLISSGNGCPSPGPLTKKGKPMERIKIAHTGDLHLDLNTISQVEPALAEMQRKLSAENPDLLVVAGDLFVKREHIHPVALNILSEFLFQASSTCEVLVIPGNHDASNSGQIDSATAAISLLDSEKRIHLINKPKMFTEALTMEKRLQICCLPSPNKYLYQSRLGSFADEPDVNKRIGDELKNILWGWAAELDPKLPSILIYHGTVVGGETDSEMLMSTGIDIAIPRGAYEKAFTALMAAHLHKPQRVGAWHYCGSPAPLTFAQVAQQPSFLLWELVPGSSSSENPWISNCRRIPLPVAQQLIQLEIREEDVIRESCPVECLLLRKALAEEAHRIGGKCWQGAKVKIKASIPESFKKMWDEEEVRKLFRHDGIEPASISIITDFIPATKIRSSELSIDSNIHKQMEAFIGVNEDLLDIAGSLHQFTDEVEDGIPQEKRMKLAGPAYEPITLKWENWKQFKDGEINFTELGGLTVITGGNTSGKSNAVETEAFVLFRYLRGSSTLSDVIRNGQKGCWVEFTFAARGKFFRVTRKLKQSGQQFISDVLLEGRPQEALPWVVMNAEDSRATQKMIEGLVGSKDFYLSSKYASQFQIDRPLSMTPAELKDLVQSALPLELFGERERIGKELYGETLRKKLSVNDQIIKIEEALEAREGLQKDKKEAEELIEVSTERLKLMGKKHQLSQDELTGKKKEQEELGKIQAEVKRLRGRLDEKRGKLLKAQKESEGLTHILNQKDEIEKGVEQLEMLEARVRPMQIAKVNDARIHLEIQKLLLEMQSQANEITVQTSRQGAQVKGLKERIKLLLDVPCQDLSNWPGADQGEKSPVWPEDFQGCQFLLDAKKAKDDLPAAVEALKALEQTKVDVKLAIKVKKLEEERGGLESFDELQSVYKAIDQLKEEKWKQKLLLFKEARGKQDGLNELITQLTEDHKQLLLEHDQKKEAVTQSKMDALLASINVLISDVYDLTQGQERERSILNKNLTDKGHAEGRLRELLLKATELTKLKSQHEELGLAERSQNSYLRAVARDGIPFLLLEQAVPELARLANQFLGNAPLALEIQPDLSGKRDQLAISFHDELGIHRLSEASGYQRMALGICIRGALIKIQAQAMGAEVNHFFIDEGFGAYDSENLQHGREMLQLLAQEFKKVIFITHVIPMQQIADTILHVEPGPDGSTIRKGA
jgi:exonuclease SbcD